MREEHRYQGKKIDRATWFGESWGGPCLLVTWLLVRNMLRYRQSKRVGETRTVGSHNDLALDVRGREGNFLAKSLDFFYAVTIMIRRGASLFEH
jgi:hypothetical protein